MTRNRAVLACLAALILGAAGAGAMPSSFVDQEEGKSGWLSCGLRLFVPVSGGGRNLAFEFSGAGPERFGFALEIGGSGVGHEGIMFSVAGLYYLDPLPSEDFTLPLRLRLGILSASFASNWFCSLSAGALVFAPRLRYDDPENPKELAMTAGADGELYYFDGRLYPAASFSGLVAFRMGPDQGGGYYYVYY
jgi:hypothetical protein